MKTIQKVFIISLLSITGLCVALSTISVIGNANLPQHSPVIETLSEADKIRAIEFLHLHEQLGSAVFPGWGEADIPLILCNEEYAFLIGYPNPPDGWVKVPAGIERGSVWEMIPGDAFMQQPYYRQRLLDPEITPEAFTVMVGNRWTTSLQTRTWLQISLALQIRADLPEFLQPIFPYRLFTAQLVSGSDQYISLTAHETFHAYQGMMSPKKICRCRVIQPICRSIPLG